jgi:energy-coupling factor transporter transmembrane protein EcfT
MHPVIKIVSFLVFGAAVSMGNGQILLAGVSLVLPLYLFGNKIHFRGVLVMLRRLKWYGRMWFGVLRLKA